MTDTEIKEKILKIFKEERQRPDLEFEESHFLDFLTFPAHSRNNIKNSFKGVKRYYQFMDRLELEFSICFTLPDLDKTYSIDKITKKVVERIGKKRGNVMIIKQRTEQRETYYIEIILAALTIIIYTFWGIDIISIILTFAFGFAFYWILSSKINDKLHNKKLKVKIMNLKKHS